MKKNLTVLFDDYINELKYSARLRPRTIQGYKAVFFLFLKVMPEVSAIEYLTPEMLNEFFKRIETRQRVVGKSIKSGVKKSTIKTLWSKGFIVQLILYVPPAVPCWASDEKKQVQKIIS